MHPSIEIKANLIGKVDKPLENLIRDSTIEFLGDRLKTVGEFYSQLFFLSSNQTDFDNKWKLLFSDIPTLSDMNLIFYTLMVACYKQGIMDFQQAFAEDNPALLKNCSIARTWS